MKVKKANQVVSGMSAIWIFCSGTAFAEVPAPSIAPVVPTSAAPWFTATDIAQKEAYELASQGYISVSDATTQKLSLAELSKNFVAPTSINSVLSEFNPGPGTKLQGMIANGTSSDGKNIDVVRVYSTANGSLLILTESDFVAAGQKVMQEPDMINVSVHGAPATLTRRRSPNGSSFSMLTWITEKKVYTLIQTEQPVDADQGPNKRLLKLAEGLSE